MLSRRNATAATVACDPVGIQEIPPGPGRRRRHPAAPIDPSPNGWAPAGGDWRARDSVQNPHVATG